MKTEEGGPPRGLIKERPGEVSDALPRAMAPEDVSQLLCVIEDTRNRTMVVMLSRIGVRIVELVALRIQDFDLSEQKVFIHEARKTVVGRVVYFSSDARDALVAWLEERDPRDDVLAYRKKYESITCAAARAIFVKYLKEAGFLHNGCSLHCLRRTFATELLNAGMRLETPQPTMCLRTARGNVLRRDAKGNWQQRDQCRWASVSGAQGVRVGAGKADRPGVSRPAQPFRTNADSGILIICSGIVLVSFVISVLNSHLG